MHLTLGRSTFRWCLLQANRDKNLFRYLLGPGQKIMQHSQTHFFAEKMCIFHARHCFLCHISVFDRVNLTQKRTGDHSHNFLSRLRMHRNNLEATENQKEVWAQSWTTWSIFTAFAKISRTQGSRDICPHRTVYSWYSQRMGLGPTQPSWSVSALFCCWFNLVPPLFCCWYGLVPYQLYSVVGMAWYRTNSILLLVFLGSVPTLFSCFQLVPSQLFFF